MRTSIVAVILLFTAHAVPAQRVDQLLGPAASRLQTTTRTDSVTPGDQALMAVVGVTGGFLGLFVGAKVGCSLDGSRGDDGCLAGAIEGLVVGEAVGLGLGVHWGNRSRGNALLTELASLGITAASIIAARGCNSESCTNALALGLPIFQLVATIGAEGAMTQNH